MDDEKLKIVLAVLGGIVFSLIFILLAFAMPIRETSPNSKASTKPKTHLEKISHEMKK